jgi:hypothetical protein
MASIVILPTKQKILFHYSLLIGAGLPLSDGAFCECAAEGRKFNKKREAAAAA